MIEKLNTHYSFTNPATVHDEEALTTLELVGRTTAKLNEVVDDQNTLRTETETHLLDQDETITKRMKAQDDSIKNIREVTVPADVKAEFQQNVNNGTFDNMIDTYAGELEERVNNLLGSVSEGSTIMDAEIIDVRTAANGITYTNAGESSRQMDKIILNHVGTLSDAIGVYEIELTDLPIEHADKYILGTGVLDEGNGMFCVRRLDIPDNVVSMSYEYGSKTIWAGRYYAQDEDNSEFNLNSPNNYINVNGGYVLLNQCLTDTDFTIKNIVLRTYESYQITDDCLFTKENKTHHTKFVHNGNIQTLVNCDIHKIEIEEGYNYYIEDYSENAYYGCLYDVNNNFIGNITWDENNKINIGSASYMLFNVFGATDIGFVKLYKELSLVSIKEVTEDEVPLYTVLDKPYNFSGKSAVVFGDSITAGVTSELKTTGNSYIRLFCNKAGLTLTNRAVSGSTLANYSISEGVTPIFEMVNNETGNYDFIFIAGGTNDYNTGRPLGEFGSTDNTTTYGALKEICESLKLNYPNAKVIFITPVNVTKSFPRAINTLNIYRKAIQDVALSYGFGVVDGSILGLPDKASTSSNVLIGNEDGCHPTELGHRIYSMGLCTQLL